ncbi:MAG: hypothetical protein ACP5GJ_02920 [Nanopusillaceae archaeon]
MEVYGIGIKIEVESGELKIRKEKNQMILEYNKQVSSNMYNDYKKKWEARILFEDNKIKLLDSNINLYIYDFNQINNKERIFGFNKVIYLGYNLKKDEEFEIKDKPFLLSPSDKIILGDGKIESSFYSKLVDENRISRDILYIMDGLLIINNII